MRIAFLSTNDNLGGAATVTMRLIEALRERGEDAYMVCARHELKDAPYVYAVSRRRWLSAFLLERLSIFVRNGLRRSRLFKVSSASTGCGVCDMPQVRDADVIVLNWINQGFLSMRDIDCLCSLGKPVVWIMHDLWCATGICHLPGWCSRYIGECGYCPLLGNTDKDGRFTDLSHRVWEQKKALYDRHPDLHFVAVSRWQHEMCLRSNLLGKRTIHILPHAFPVEDYSVNPSAEQLASLREMGINPERRLIVMAAARLDDDVKDLPMAVKALNALAATHPELARECQAVFAGELRDASMLSDLVMDHVATGQLTSAQLRAVYSAATAVISTSDFETMGATLMEGIASGATAVTFDRGGQRDIVIHASNGYIAAYKDPADFAACLSHALAAPFDRTAQKASIAARFTAPVIATRFLNILRAL